MTYSIGIMALLTSLICAAVSQIVVKQRMTHLQLSEALNNDAVGAIFTATRDLTLLSGVGLSILGAGFWYLALTRLPVSLMMPTAALIVPMSLLGAYVWLAEPISPQRLAAVAVIVVGVVFLHLTS